MAYDPREDDKEYFLTGLLDTVENGVIGSVNWLKKQAEDNPDTWTDDAFRLAGGGFKDCILSSVSRELLTMRCGKNGLICIIMNRSNCTS